MRQQQAIDEPETAEPRDACRGSGRESRSAAQVRQQRQGREKAAHLTTFNSKIERDQAPSSRRAGTPPLAPGRRETEAAADPERKGESPTRGRRGRRAAAARRPAR